MGRPWVVKHKPACFWPLPSPGEGNGLDLLALDPGHGAAALEPDLLGVIPSSAVCFWARDFTFLPIEPIIVPLRRVVRKT